MCRRKLLECVVLVAAPNVVGFVGLAFENPFYSPDDYVPMMVATSSAYVILTVIAVVLVIPPFHVRRDDVYQPESLEPQEHQISPPSCPDSPAKDPYADSKMAYGAKANDPAVTHGNSLIKEVIGGVLQAILGMSNDD